LITKNGASHETIIYDAFQSLTSLPSLYEKFTNRILDFSAEDADKVMIYCSKGKKADFWRFAAVDIGILGTKG